MKKKIVIVGILIFIVLIGIVLIVKKNNDNIIVSEFYSQYKEDVDSGVESFMGSETFNKMNEANQIKEINNLLKMYQNDGVIKNLYYDSSNKLYSFEYNYGETKGALGGVSLKDMDPMMN